MATCGEIVSTHMPKKSRVENWLHECQLLASVTLPLGGTVGELDVTTLLEFVTALIENLNSCNMDMRAFFA